MRLNTRILFEILAARPVFFPETFPCAASNERPAKYQLPVMWRVVLLTPNVSCLAKKLVIHKTFLLYM